MREETRLVRQLLRDRAMADETATYADIEAMAGWNPGEAQGKRRNVIYQSLKWLEREHGFSSVVEPRVGYRFIRGTRALLNADQQRVEKIKSQIDKYAGTYNACQADADDTTRYMIANRIGFLEAVVTYKTMELIDKQSAQIGQTIDWRKDTDKSREVFMGLCKQLKGGV